MRGGTVNRGRKWSGGTIHRAVDSPGDRGDCRWRDTAIGSVGSLTIVGVLINVSYPITNYHADSQA